MWIPIWVDQLAQDVRYAIPAAFGTARASCLVIATLALGIGLTTAVFSVVNAVSAAAAGVPGRRSAGVDRDL